MSLGRYNKINNDKNVKVLSLSMNNVFKLYQN